jgi:hypothetical protein
VGLLQVHLELELMRHYMPFTVINAIMTISGSVNMNPVQVGDRSFGPEHVLFLMGEISPTADPATGGRLWDIPLRLLCSANHTWNEFLNEKGVYEIVKTSGAGGVSPYPVSDISILFGIDFT